MEQIYICEHYDDCTVRRVQWGCMPHFAGYGQSITSDGVCYDADKRAPGMYWREFTPTTPLEKTLVHWMRFKVRPGMRLLDMETGECELCRAYSGRGLPPAFCASCPWFQANGLCINSLGKIEKAANQSQADAAKRDIINKLKELVLEESKPHKDCCNNCDSWQLSRVGVVYAWGSCDCITQDDRHQVDYRSDYICCNHTRKHKTCQTCGQELPCA